MSSILSMPMMMMIFMIGGMKLNVSPDMLLLVMAIIAAGGLAGLKD